MLAQAASADPLRECAAGIVENQNRERTEDVLRIAAFALGVPLERLEGAQLLWLDRLGIYLFAATVGGPGAQVRPVSGAPQLASDPQNFHTRSSPPRQGSVRQPVHGKS